MKKYLFTLSLLLISIGSFADTEKAYTFTAPNHDTDFYCAISNANNSDIVTFIAENNTFCFKNSRLNNECLPFVQIPVEAANNVYFLPKDINSTAINFQVEVASSNNNIIINCVNDSTGNRNQSIQ